jgi:alpha-ketoglutarate-dependent taurine dioxygenase
MNVKESVFFSGWGTTTCSSQDELIDLALLFGTPIVQTDTKSVVDVLRVVDSRPDMPNSWSTRFGSATFPFHTDMAYFFQPPRFLILRSAGELPSDRPTALLDMEKANLNEKHKFVLETEEWLIQSGRSKFKASYRQFDAEHEMFFYRVDPVCMKAVENPSYSDQMIQKIAATAEIQEVFWTPGTAVVIDNWRLLHGRGLGSGQPEPDRILERVLVK